MDRWLTSAQREVLLRDSVLESTDLSVVLLKDSSGCLHLFEYCHGVYSQGGGTAHFVGLPSVPAGVCATCADSDPYHVVDDVDLRRLCSAYLSAGRELERSPRGATFAALGQLARLRAARKDLAALAAPVGPVAALLARLDARLDEYGPTELELRHLLRLWVGSDLLCNLSDCSGWPQEMLDLLDGDVPKWLYRELVQGWRAQTSTREKVRRRATPKELLRRIGHTVRPVGETERLRALDLEAFTSAFAALCAHLDAELESLAALPTEPCYLLARGGRVVDFASLQVLEAASSSQVCFVDELTGRWVESRPDLAPTVQVLRVEVAAMPPEVLEVVAGLFDPEAARFEDVPAASLPAVVEMAEGILAHS